LSSRVKDGCLTGSTKLGSWIRVFFLFDSSYFAICSSSSFGIFAMKKTLLLATLLAAFAMTACGKKEEMPVAPAEPATAPAVMEAAKEGAAATMDAAKEGAAATMDAAKEGAAAMTDAAKDSAAATTDAAKEAADKAAEAAKAAADQAADAAKAAMGAAKDAVKPAQ
jgi:hypothetical protein